MLESLRQRSTTDSTERTATSENRPASSENRPTASRDRSETDDRSPASDESSTSSGVTKTTGFRLGRLLYGGILAFMAIDGLRNPEARVEYAKAKNVPMPERANAASHGLLLAGGAGIVLWRLPRLAAGAVATFFLGVTPFMHDFWTVDDPEQKQQQMTDFLKNAALFGAALAVFGIANGSE